ncbi:MAG: zinc finger CCHC domain-containing protein [Bacteroidota bacterium]
MPQQHRQIQSVAQSSQFRPRINSSPSPNGTFPRTFDQSRTQCYKCNKLGHYARECTENQGSNIAMVATPGTSYQQSTSTNNSIPDNGSSNFEPLGSRSGNNFQQQIRGGSFNQSLNYRGRGRGHNS